jgi:manganese/zinc/iron transport system permease protein
LLIAGGGALAVVALVLLRRPMTLVAFDPEYAAATGVRVRHIDLAIMGLVLGVTLIGLKVVGLVLIVALLIIPPVTARFWSDRTSRVIWIAAAAGGGAAYVGAALSATAPNLPTGPIIVLTAFAGFTASLLLSPSRGLLAAGLTRLRFRRRVHLRQGLLALAAGHPVYEPYTLRLLTEAGLARPDGVATETGRAEAAKAHRDEARWALARQIHAHEAAAAAYDGLTPIERLLTADEIAEIDRMIGAPKEVPV